MGADSFQRVRIAAALTLCLALGGCEGGGLGWGAGFHAPTAPSEASDEAGVQLAVEPEVVGPRFSDRRGCVGTPAFHVSFRIRLHVRRALVVQGLGFELVDAGGSRSVPVPIPDSQAAASIPTQVPVPLPTSPPVTLPASSPIPIPGPTTSSSGMVMVPGNFVMLPFTLRFACGVHPGGTLFVVVLTTDGRGARLLWHTRAHVRR